MTITVVSGLTRAYATDAAIADAATAGQQGLQGVVTPGDPVAGLADFAQQGTATPLASQRQAADTLGAAQLRWNSYGTPASILPANGSLGAAPGDPVGGARSWLRTQAATFGLSAAQIDALALVNKAHAEDAHHS